MLLNHSMMNYVEKRVQCTVCRVVSYINMMVGRPLLRCNDIAQPIWKILDKYILGRENVWADKAIRPFVKDDIEIMLCMSVYRDLSSISDLSEHWIVCFKAKFSNCVLRCLETWSRCSAHKCTIIGLEYIYICLKFSSFHLMGKRIAQVGMLSM